jgi:hypothetical protein
VYKPPTDSVGKYWPFLCETCGFPIKEDLEDPSYRNYAWRFASYCINGNLSTAVKYDFDTTNLKIIQVSSSEHTLKFTTKLKLSSSTIQGEDNILRDLDIYSLKESPHLWDEIDPFGIKRYIFIADLWDCSISEIEKRQIQLLKK